MRIKKHRGNNNKKQNCKLCRRAPVLECAPRGHLAEDIWQRDSYHKASSWSQHQFVTQNPCSQYRHKTDFKSQGHRMWSRDTKTPMDFIRQARDIVETEHSTHRSTVANVDHRRKAERRVQVNIPTKTQEDWMHIHNHLTIICFCNRRRGKKTMDPWDASLLVTATVYFWLPTTLIQIVQVVPIKIRR